MLAKKSITKFVAGLMGFCVISCLLLVLFSDWLASWIQNAGKNVPDAKSNGIFMEYEEKLFDTDEVLSVNILMEDADWQDMLDNAIKEEYYTCDVEIAGKTFYNVGIRPKGNTSLTSIASDPDTDRYSLKLEFDQYVDGQTCFGLDKLILNNNYADATNMKEALIYDMFQYLGADASLYNYAKVSVNGEYRGVYLALEAVEDSFLLRNYGLENGSLYKPDGMEMGGGNKDGGGFDAGGGFGGFSMSGGGANLNYTTDSLESYKTIWDGEVTASGTSDHTRVITALKNISEGTDLEQYMDIDNLLKYMAVHIFSVNSDSLSGSMAHNYYLYESDGRLNLLPWDYNLALGGMGGMGSGNKHGGSSASNVVNSPIDDAFQSTDFFDTLMDADAFHEQYYAYLDTLVTEYLLGEGFETFYNRTRAQIDTLVETDPTAFYSYDEYLTAVETLYDVVKLRGESIQGQLNGSIPSISALQSNSDALIATESIDISVMGTMNMGGRESRDEKSKVRESEVGRTEVGESMDRESDKADFTPPDMSEAPVFPEGMQMPEGMELPDGMQIPEETQNTSKERPGRNNMSPANFNAFTNTSLSGTIILYGVCFVLLAGAVLFVFLYRRKPRKR